MGRADPHALPAFYAAVQKFGFGQARRAAAPDRVAIPPPTDPPIGPGAGGSHRQRRRQSLSFGFKSGPAISPVVDGLGSHTPESPPDSRPGSCNRARIPPIGSARPERRPLRNDDRSDRKLVQASPSVSRRPIRHKTTWRQSPARPPGGRHTGSKTGGARPRGPGPAQTHRRSAIRRQRQWFPAPGASRGSTTRETDR
jgi:hypothetical protein